MQVHNYTNTNKSHIKWMKITVFTETWFAQNQYLVKKVWRALFYLFDLFTTYYYENLWNHYLFLITYQNWICFVDEIISSWKYVKNSSLKNRNEFQISTNFFTFQSESFADLLVLVFFFVKTISCLRFIYSEKATKFEENLHLSFHVTKFCQN